MIARLRRALRETPTRLRPLDRALTVVALLILVSLVLRQGYHVRWLEHALPTLVLGALIWSAVLVSLLLRAISASRLTSYLLSNGPDLVLLALILLPGVGFRTAGILLSARILARGATRLLTSPAGRALILRTHRHPTKVVTISFLLLIAAGTLFLTFPGARAPASEPSVLTAFFTATSAVCVTGLVTVDTSSYWSTFGQITILVLIQIGGLGIMSLSASLVVLLGRSLSAGHRGALSEVVEETAGRDVAGMLQLILGFTLVCETAGALALGPHWSRTMPPAEAWYHAVFHSISAFCNAGFTTFPDNLGSYTADFVVNGVIAVLIVVGGLGFSLAPALLAFLRRPHRPVAWWRKRGSHDRLVLTMTALLLVTGAVLLLALESGRSLAGLPPSRRILAAVFQSVTARTAGFNTVSIGAMAPATATLLMILMFIGGSPGGTAGGIKTTTLGVLGLSLRSLARGRHDVEVFARRVREDTLLKAITVTLLGVVVVLAGTITLLMTQPGSNYEDVMFEVVSAFGTVGLSRGLTPSLTPLSQLTIIALMFIGRTGPLTLALALGRPARPSQFRYPEGRILVG